MRVLVTGASGFIGSHLVLKLGRTPNFDVVIHDHRAFPPDTADAACGGFQWDIRNAGEVSAFVDMASSCESIIHLAAVASPRECAADPSVAWETNVRGTANVLRLARLSGIRRVVFLSSAHVYGIPSKYFPVDETHPLHMHDDYTTTKILGEELCELYWKNYGLSYVVLRLFNTYGLGQSAAYFMGSKFRQAITENRVVVAGPAITKDWIAITDVCRAIKHALCSEYVGALNVGTGQQTSLGKIGQRIADFWGVPYTEEASADPGPSKMQCDRTRIERVLDWRPLINIQEGLDNLMARVRAEALEPTPKGKT